MRALVVGVGQVDRGDDAVGPRVAELVVVARPDGVDVTALPTPVHLAESWEGYDLVVVVDAIRSGAAPGEVTTRTLGDRPLAPRSGAAGTHGFGVSEAVELARATGSLPRRLVLVGVEAASFRLGAPVSPAVEAALPTAERAVLDALGKDG